MNPRLEAFNILFRFYRTKDINLKDELDDVLPKIPKKEDRTLITHIVYGVVRYLAKLKWVTERLLQGKKTSPKIEVLLWIGIYSFLEFDRVPSYATVYEIVEIAKKVEKGRAYNFVNALLRKFLREKDAIDIPQTPEIRYSLPSWFVKRWKKRLPGEWDDFFSANNRVPPLSIRVNTLKITTYELKKILLQEGVGKIEEGRWHDVLKIYGYPYIKDLRSYKMGYFTVQDEGAMWVSHVLSPNPGETVLDLCSSPGGKTFHIATLMSNKGLVYAVDIKDDVLIKETKERLGIDIIKPIRFDLRKEMKNFYQKADKVLLDAPCTGLGTMRRRPELKWKRNEKDIYRMSDLQKLLIKNAVKYVKTGGTLVYSVCTLEREEGEDVVKYLLTLSPNYELSPIDGKPYLYLYPHIYDTDGFFMAKIKVK